MRQKKTALKPNPAKRQGHHSNRGGRGHRVNIQEGVVRMQAAARIPRVGSPNLQEDGLEHLRMSRFSSGGCTDIRALLQETHHDF